MTHLRLVPPLEPDDGVRSDTDRRTIVFDRQGWEDHLATTGLKGSTIAQYRALGQRLADHLPDPHVPTPSAVRGWSETLTGSQSMRDQARSAIREYGTWLGLDPEPLRAAIWRPSSPPKPRWRSLPPSTIRDILPVAHAAGREGTATLLALYGALRRSEVAGVRWDKVDLETAQAEVWRPKNLDWHLIPLHPVLVERLTVRQTRLDVGPDVPWLFRGRYGGHVSWGTVGAWVKAIAAEAGHPDVTCHDLRHSCATAVYDDSKDLVLAQTLLGHRRPETTARYVRPNRQAVADAVNRLSWDDDDDGMPAAA